MIVIACDDSKLVNRWHRTFAEKYPLYVVSQKTALVRALSSLKPRLLILDSSLPRLRAVKELPKIQQLSPVTKILVISDTPTIREGVAVLKAGAKGYCAYTIGSNLLHKAVRVVLNGELWAGRKIVTALIEEIFPASNDKQLLMRSKTPLDDLSARKREIAKLVVEGATNRAIASRLNISEATVKAHLTGIFRQFQLSGRLQLVLLVATTMFQ